MLFIIYIVGFLTKMFHYFCKNWKRRKKPKKNARNGKKPEVFLKMHLRLQLRRNPPISEMKKPVTAQSILRIDEAA